MFSVLAWVHSFIALRMNGDWPVLSDEERLLIAESASGGDEQVRDVDMETNTMDINSSGHVDGCCGRVGAEEP